MNHPIEYHYSPTEIAHLLGLSLNAIYGSIRAGKLQAIKIDDPHTFKGYRLRISSSALETWLKSIK